MKKILTALAMAAMIATPALAQAPAASGAPPAAGTPAKPATPTGPTTPAAPMAKPMDAKPMAKTAMTADEKKAKSKECSLKADAKSLHGKERKTFREACKKG